MKIIVLLFQFLIILSTFDVNQFVNLINLVMKSNNPYAIEVAIILVEWKVLKDGSCPLMLRLTKNGKRKYKTIGHKCHPKLWDPIKCQVKKSHPERVLLNNLITQLISKIKNQILEFQRLNKPISLDSILNAQTSPLKVQNVLSFYIERISQFKKDKKLGNARAYQYSYNRFSAFRKNKDLAFSELNYSMLNKFESYLKENNVSDTTLSVHFRTLRALYNEAILEKIASKDDYPFQDFKVSKFNLETRKRALTREELNLIKASQIQPSDKIGTSLFDAKNYFLFSYYAAGINFIDLANLKWKDLEGNRIYYTRTKTGRKMKCLLKMEAISIIDYYRKITFDSTDQYIFPILDRKIHISIESKRNRHQKLNKTINNQLKKIAISIGITKELTYYVARHTFATMLKLGGLPTSVAQSYLGHTDERTTRIYQEELTSDSLDYAIDVL
ncbi:MAG: phage integrase SAM-like domain-containing protein [Bacteroidia bacterium]